jgi:hypothetical protein
LEKEKEDIRGNLSPAYADFLTKELFRYIMACGEDLGRIVAKAQMAGLCKAPYQTAMIANIARRQTACMRS